MPTPSEEIAALSSSVDAMTARIQDKLLTDADMQSLTDIRTKLEAIGTPTPVTPTPVTPPPVEPTPTPSPTPSPTPTPAEPPPAPPVPTP